jgi:Tol biopolymer transport system component
VPVAGSGSTVESPVAELPPIRPKDARRSRYFGLATLGAAIVALGAFVMWRTVVQNSAAPRVLRFTRLTNDGQVKGGPLATDGSRIYINETLPGPRHIVVQVSVHGGETVPLVGQLKQPSVFDVSADGTELLLGDDEGHGFSLWVQPVAGGSPRRIGSTFGHEASFGRGPEDVIYETGHDVYSVHRDGSESRKLLDAGNVAFSLQYSPDARVFRFSTFDLQVDDMFIMESASDGSKLRKTFQGCCGKWTSDGRYYVFQNRNNGRLDLWTLPEKRWFWRRREEEKATQLTAGPLDFQYPLPGKDNKQIFAIGTSHRAELVRYDRHTAQFLPYLSGISAQELAFSRDGLWVAYASFPDGALWRSKVDGSEKRQLTFPPLRVFSPSWSPDGKQIAFSADRPSTARNVYTISGEGGTPKRVLPSEQGQSDVDWSPDGNVVVFGTLFVTNAPIYTLDLRSQTVSVLPGSFEHYGPKWSPDGRFIAAIASGPLGKLMLYEVSTQQWSEVSSFPVGCPIWSHDGKYVYFQYSRKLGQNAYDSIARFRLADRKVENVVDLQEVGRLTAGTFVGWFGLAPDDSPLFARDISVQEIYAIEMQWP